MGVLAACAAVAGALGFAAAAVLQQYAAALAPSGATGVRLLLHLARRPVWIAGVAAMVAGSGLHLLALGNGPLLLVQPLGVGAVVFTLPMAAALHHRRVRPREWTAAALVATALCAVLFLLPAHPGGTPAGLGVPALVGATVAVVAVLGSVAWACTGAVRAPLFAIGAGTAFGVVSALVRIVLTGGTFGTAQAIAAAAVAPLSVLGFLLSQYAYRTGGAAVVLATVTVTDPVAAVLAGALVLGETVPASPVRWALSAGCAALIVAGVAVLARSAAPRPGLVRDGPEPVAAVPAGRLGRGGAER